MLKLGLALSVLLTIPGELIRVPIGPGRGILLNDIFLPVLITFWLLRKIAADRRFPKTHLGIPLIIFVGIAIASLIHSLTFLNAKETLIGSFYLLRFIAYALLYIITIDIVKSQKDIRRILALIIGTAALIALAGFVQLQIYPDFRAMEDLGWDPHVGRLLSTWFDPNFTGGLLAFVSCITLGFIFHSKKLSLWPTAALALFVAAIFFTYSRSSYLSLAIGMFTIGALRSRKFLIAIIIGAVVLIPLSPRAQTRIVNMYHTAESLIAQTAETPDVTARHRINSWKRAVEVYKKHPVLGAGYNTFKYIQSREGMIANVRSHAASGSDSSLLTILATTGPLGFLAFLAIYIITLRSSYRTWRDRKQKPLARGLGLGLFGGTLSLLVHSVFVNSLLFPHIMVFFWIANGLSQTSFLKNS